MMKVLVTKYAGCRRLLHERRRKLPILVIALSTAAVVQSALVRQVLADSQAEASRQPNVLVILADDLGQETLGCYGGESYKTPHLDRLARGGIRFRHCYSMPVCHPTRITLLTGRYPFRLDNPRWGTFPQAEEKQTIAQVMRSGGYRTAIAGKWQLILMKQNPRHPFQLGFDDYSLFGWHEGPRYFDPLIYQNGRLRSDVTGRYGPDVYVDFLVDFMTRHRDRPFFAFYSMALCHNVTDDLKQPVPFGPNGRYMTYAEMVESADTQVGKLIAALDRLKLRQRTVILFTGDNGTSKSYIHSAVDGKLISKPVSSTLNGVDVRGGKGELTDAGTRVPLIANWPGTIKPGQVVDDLVDLSDFLPTLAELGHATLPEGVKLDGRSFAARLLGKQAQPRDWVYAQQGGKYWVGNQQWKLYNDGRLFNVKADPREQKPIRKVGQSSAAADARRKLHKILNRVRPPAPKAS
jgi:arylsulfatase A-like enzyme